MSPIRCTSPVRLAPLSSFPPHSSPGARSVLSQRSRRSFAIVSRAHDSRKSREHAIRTLCAFFLARLPMIGLRATTTVSRSAPSGTGDVIPGVIPKSSRRCPSTSHVGIACRATVVEGTDPSKHTPSRIPSWNGSCWAYVLLDGIYAGRGPMRRVCSLSSDHACPGREMAVE